MILEMKDIHKSYEQGGDRIEVLSQFSLAVNEGEILGIVGESGSGKSTLLALMAGLDRPDRGEIRIAGQDIVPLSEAELTLFRAQYIGIVFQQFHLLPHLSALENVQLPLEILDRESELERAKEILDVLGMGHRLKHYPSQLSGGEAQRVALARALVVRPKILLADEPTGSLDPKTGQKIMDYFFQICRQFQTTAILVTHNMDFAQKCDRSVHLNAANAPRGAAK
jgi:putative ABC transport system ATP-binding protein